MSKPITIGIIAGEISGDNLGGNLMRALICHYPQVRFVGVGGEQMAAQGLNSLFAMQRLSVMGIAEVAYHLPSLLSAKNKLIRAFDKADIDMFIGIDAPDFNLRISKILKKKGVFCVHYVSPSVWAWREGRIHTIKEATHLVLCLLPFEAAIYAHHNHPAIYVGHPLIKTLTPVDNQHTLTKFLSACLPNFNANQKRICLMSGSRISEITVILPILLASFDKLLQNNCKTLGSLPLLGILPLAKDDQKSLVQSIIDKNTPHLLPFLHILTPSDWHHWQNNHIQSANNSDTIQHKIAHLLMQNSDITLIASGTATLEALLVHAPMVAVYKINALSYQLVRRLLNIPYVALPNILYHHYNPQDKPLIPELIQEQATADNLTHHALTLLDNPNAKTLLTNFANQLRQDNNIDIAQVIFSHYYAALH